MKSFVSSIILLFILSHVNYSQAIITECNTGVITQLNSSSNCKSNYWYSWQGWACGINGTVLKSIGSSSQWRNVSGGGIPSNISLDNICGLDSSIAFVAGHLNADTWVWKTTNGGQNWFQVFTQPNGRVNAVWMSDYNKGFMQGNPVNGRWSLWQTTNGGTNWDSAGLYLLQAGTETGWPNSLCIPMGLFNPTSDSNKIWFGTNNFRIYYSSDFGQHWNPQSTSPEQNSFCIAFGQEISMAKVLYAGGSTYLLKSTNDGINWITITIGGTGNISGAALCWYTWNVVRGNKIYDRSYGSENWYAYYTAPSGNYTYLDNRGFGIWFDHYAVRDNGGITFETEGEGVQKITSEIPTRFSLFQNYPNPFNPVTKIKFSIPLSGGVSAGRGGFVSIKIYDALGREVAALVNEQLSPGSYETEWDGSAYSSGVYFYKLITSDFTETRKMVLVK